MPYEKMKMTQLVHHINRLEWAADTTKDYKWRKVHIQQRQFLIELLLEKFNLVN